MRPCPARFSVIIACVVACGIVAVGSSWNEARAQAWVGGKGELEVGLDYNLGISKKVIGDGDIEYENAGTTTHQFTLGAEYVPIAKLAASVGVPLALLKYTGDLTMYPHNGGGTYDDGATHTVLTDLRAGVRYQVLEEPIALSPHLAGSIPLTNYENVGNTVAGRHLKALHAGLGIGKTFGAAPTYVHLLYEFSLVEKLDISADTAKHSQNRSDVAFTIGHKLLDQRLDLHVDLNLRETHGGVSFSELEGGTLTLDEATYHDAILDEDIILVGGGLGFQVSNTLALSLGARFFVAGENTQNASVIAFGVAWSPLN
ncbi:MAG TPA: hypothetical protein VNO30_49090 [Kofleriaceae bacterium]|nr:hypothetical protein [Kofleriaceae bacterium]